MNSRTPPLIEFIHEQDVLIVAPKSALEWATPEAYEVELKAAVQQQLTDSDVRYVVIDLAQIQTLSSALLGYLVALWKITKRRGGAMAMCGLAPLGQTVLAVAHMNKLWPIVRSRDEALRNIRSAKGPAWDAVDEASDESFPASDAPSWTAVIGAAS